MKSSKNIRLCLFVLGLLLLAPNYLYAQGTAFTYQGRLATNGIPANGNYDLSFSVFSVISGGSSVAGPVTKSGTGVTNGLFTVTLDFGAGLFTGTNYWLDISVRTNGGGTFYGP